MFLLIVLMLCGYFLQDILIRMALACQNCCVQFSIVSHVFMTRWRWTVRWNEFEVPADCQLLTSSHRHGLACSVSRVYRGANCSATTNRRGVSAPDCRDVERVPRASDSRPTTRSAAASPPLPHRRSARTVAPSRAPVPVLSPHSVLGDLTRPTGWRPRWRGNPGRGGAGVSHRL